MPRPGHCLAALVGLASLGGAAVLRGSASAAEEAAVSDAFDPRSRLRPAARRKLAPGPARPHQRKKTFAGLQLDSPPWQLIKQWDTTGKDRKNLCRNGRLLPQLYIIGAAKSATTSLAIDLLAAGVESVGPDCRGWCTAKHAGNTNVEKEFHFFDKKMDWKHLGSQGLNVSRGVWERLMPRCPKKLQHERGPRRRVIADFTPEYLRMTPLPPGAKYANDTMANWLQLYPGQKQAGGDHGLPNFILPQVLRGFYGPTASRRPTFVMMLREPMDRMRSLYDCCICPVNPKTGKPWRADCQKYSFEHRLSLDLGRLRQPQPVYTDMLWGGFYGAQFESWLEYFSASQFYVLPFRIFTRGGPEVDNVCRAISKRIDFRINCDSGGTKATWLERKRSSSHSVSARASVSQAVQAAFDAAVGPDTEKLGDALAFAHRQGAGLAAFEISASGADPAAAEPKEVLSWLKAHW